MIGPHFGLPLEDALSLHDVCVPLVGTSNHTNQSWMLDRIGNCLLPSRDTNHENRHFQVSGSEDAKGIRVQSKDSPSL